MIWTFANFELDERNCVLQRAGEPVPIRRRVFAVLHYLIAHSGALVTKEELLANVWPNESIVEAVLPQNIAILRQLLGDDHKPAKFIQTVHGRGYRFVAPVTRSSPPPLAANMNLPSASVRVSPHSGCPTAVMRTPPTPSPATVNTRPCTTAMARGEMLCGCTKY